MSGFFPVCVCDGSVKVPFVDSTFHVGAAGLIFGRWRGVGHDSFRARIGYGSGLTVWVGFDTAILARRCCQLRNTSVLFHPKFQPARSESKCLGKD